MLNFTRCWQRPKFVHIYVLYEYSYLDVPASAAPPYPPPAPLLSPNSPKLLPELRPPAWMYYREQQYPSTQSLHFSRQGQPRGLVGFQEREAWTKHCVLPNVCLFPSIEPTSPPKATWPPSCDYIWNPSPPHFSKAPGHSQKLSHLGAWWWE